MYMEVTQAEADIISERRRHVEVEGWTPEHDDEHSNGELARAAAAYALVTVRPYDWIMNLIKEIWPFDTSWWKPITSDRRNLVKAGSMIVAEIERRDRQSVSTRQPDMSKQST